MEREATVADVIDLSEARKRKADKKLKDHIRKSDDQRDKYRKDGKLAEALRKYGNLNGSESLKRIQNLFKKEEVNADSDSTKHDPEPE